MAALPPIRRFLIEDFKTQKEWISPLLLTLNNFMEAVVNALNVSLTIKENTTGDVKVVAFSGAPSASAPVSVSWTKATLPTSVIVGNIQRVDGANFTLSSAVQVQWQMSTTPSTLQIINIVGVTLSATDQYYLTLICFTG